MAGEEPGQEPVEEPVEPAGSSRSWSVDEAPAEALVEGEGTSPVVAAEEPGEEPGREPVEEPVEPPIEPFVALDEAPAEALVEGEGTSPVVAAEEPGQQPGQEEPAEEPVEPPIEPFVAVDEAPAEALVAGEGTSPVVAGEEPVETPMAQLLVVDRPYAAERPPAQPESGPSRRTRLPVLVLTAVVLVAALVAYLGWRLVGEDRQEAAPTPTTSSTTTPSPSSAPTPSPTPSTGLSATASPSVEVPPLEPPDGGSYLEVTVLDSGDLDVDQWVRSSTPLTALACRSLRTRSSATRSSPPTSGLSADGQEADVPTSLSNTPVVITLAGVNQVHLTYRLSGALLLSPSRADRALARAVALDLELNGVQGREPATIRFRDATALTVICDDGGSQLRCGRLDDNGDWQVQAADSGAQDRVTALLELPSPSAG